MTTFLTKPVQKKVQPYSYDLKPVEFRPLTARAIELNGEFRTQKGPKFRPSAEELGSVDTSHLISPNSTGSGLPATDRALSNKTRDPVKMLSHAQAKSIERSLESALSEQQHMPMSGSTFAYSSRLMAGLPDDQPAGDANTQQQKQKAKGSSRVKDISYLKDAKPQPTRLRPRSATPKSTKKTNSPKRPQSAKSAKSHKTLHKPTNVQPVTVTSNLTTDSSQGETGGSAREVIKQRLVAEAVQSDSDSEEAEADGQTQHVAMEFDDLGIPPSLIPETYHVYSGAPLSQEQTQEQLRFDSSKNSFHVRIFPALVPSGRQDVWLLKEWVEKSVSQIQSTPEEAPKKRKIYDIALYEVMRQVYVQCNDRGLLMERIINEVNQLNQQREARANTHAEEVSRLKKELAVVKSQNAINSRYLESKHKTELESREDRTKTLERRVKELEGQLAVQRPGAQEDKASSAIMTMMGKVKAIEQYIDRLEDLVPFDYIPDILKTRAYRDQRNTIDRTAHRVREVCLAVEWWREEIEKKEKLVGTVNQTIESKNMQIKGMERQLADNAAEIASLKEQLEHAGLRPSNHQETQTEGDDDHSDTESVAYSDYPDLMSPRTKYRDPLWFLVSKLCLKKKARPVTEKALLELISKTLKAKVAADEAAERQGANPQPLPKFVHQSFLRKFGIKKLADQQCVDLRQALITQQSNKRIRLFGRYMGMYEPLGLEAFKVYLRVFSEAMARKDKLETWFKEVPTGFLIQRPFALEVIKAAVEREGMLLSDNFFSRLNLVLDREAGGSEENHMFDFDLIMDTVMTEWVALENEINESLKSQYQQDLGSSGEQEMSYERFHGLLQSLCSPSPEETLEMYSEAAGEEGMTQSAFVEVCRTRPHLLKEMKKGIRVESVKMFQRRQNVFSGNSADLLQQLAATSDK